MHNPDFDYRGLSYEQASREATRLIERHGWFQSFERLVALRGIMLQEYARGHAAHFPYQSWGPPPVGHDGVK